MEQPSPKPARAVAWTSPSITRWLRDRVTAAGGNPADVPDEEFRFLRLPEVRRRVGLSTSSIYRKVLEGVFPPPIPLGERSSENTAPVEAA